MQVLGKSHVGLLRKKNEDSYLIDEKRRLFAVCDGMGGHKAGDIASQLAINILDKNIDLETAVSPAMELEKAVRAANAAILEKARDNDQFFEMGTTLTAALINNSKATIAHVGDSSLYIIRDNKITKITSAHTLAKEMNEKGLLKPEEINKSAYKHVLTRALGIEAELKLDIISCEIRRQDLIIICSDGLTDMLSDEEIMVIKQEQEKIDSLADELMKRALDKGGCDNITFILIQV